jgi:SAM-dependent methyltransferase
MTGRSDRFTPPKLYERLFGMPQHVLEGLCEEFWRKVFSSQNAKYFQDRADIRVLSVGYGTGRLDLPFWEAMTVQASQHVEKLALEIIAVEPMWAGTTSVETDLEPTYKSMAHERLTKAGYQIQTDTGSLVYVRTEPDIRIRMDPSTIEDWLEKSPGEDGFDCICCFFVVHLLDDWKHVLSQLVKRLEPGGLLAFAQNTGNVRCLDGHFDSPPDKGSKDNAWERFWWCVFQERDNLFIPRVRIVSPRDLSVADQVLETWGMTGCQGVPGPLRAEREERKSVLGEDLKMLLESTRDGLAAKTFGSLRIPSKSAASVFCGRVAAILENSELKATSDVDYTLGIELVARFRGERAANSATDDYLRTAIACIRDHTLLHASTLRNSIKRCMSAKPDPSEERLPALAAALTGVREIMGFSRNSWLVLNTRLQKEYLTAITLLPRYSMVSNKADDFLRRYSVYVAGPPSGHLSRLLEQDVAGELGDISVLVRFNADSAELKWLFSPEGHPEILIVGFDRNQTRNLDDLMEESLSQWTTLSDELDALGAEGYKNAVFEQSYMAWNSVKELRKALIQNNCLERILDLSEHSLVL